MVTQLEQMSLGKAVAVKS